jgi:hypothetical protein
MLCQIRNVENNSLISVLVLISKKGGYMNVTKDL